MVEIQILGSAQDGGVPHVGCICKNCLSALNNPVKQRMVASLAIIGDMKNFMIDATPNFTMQAAYLKRVYPDKSIGFDGLFLSHLHIGHYTGLVHLGKEAASTDEFPVYMSKPVFDYLKQNKPYSYLIDRGEIIPVIIEDQVPITIDTGLDITPIEVPHRNEDANTFGFIMTNTIHDRSGLYLPDIDVLTEDVVDLINRMDLTIFDGTFYTSDEIPHQHEVPHPPIVDTMAALGKVDEGSFYFTHFNPNSEHVPLEEVIIAPWFSKLHKPREID